VYGYENLLTVIQDPTHEEYESTLEWLGGRFDPDTFDPKRVKFDDPARRYQLAFEEPRKRAGDVAQRRPVARAASGRAETPTERTTRSYRPR